MRLFQIKWVRFLTAAVLVLQAAYFAGMIFAYFQQWSKEVAELVSERPARRRAIRAAG